jgi:hypothetical protein
MNAKSIKYIVMVVLFSLALISCNQSIPLDRVQETSSENVTTATSTAEVFSYQRISLLDNVKYEIPVDWQTHQDGTKVYHYRNDENYLMVSSVETEFGEDSDQALTDQCADILLESLNTYENFSLETDSTGEVDGAYCRKIVCSYSDDTDHSVIERSVTFSVGGVVYSFDCISFSNMDSYSEDFRRIIGSIVLS